MSRLCSVKIDLDALVSNAEKLKALTNETYFVLKSDAYGHGAIRCAKALFEAKMSRFAVFSLEEALEIKPYVGEARVLILGRTPGDHIAEVSRNGFTQTVFSEEYVKEILPYSRGLKTEIKLDCGMHRSGFTAEASAISSALSGFKGEICGVYSHLSCADAPDLSHARIQLNDFVLRAEALENELGSPLEKHVAASAAALRISEARLGLCRIGLALYGIMPECCENRYGLEPVMSVNAAVISVQRVKKNEFIGYGCEHRVKRDSVIATVAMGYANGLERVAAKCFMPIINGYRVPFAANICMDRCMLDVTEIFEAGGSVKPYDTALIVGDGISVYDLARAEGTIPYEVLTGLGRMN